jgi:hypothetical protein
MLPRITVTRKISNKINDNAFQHSNSMFAIVSGPFALQAAIEQITERKTIRENTLDKRNPAQQQIVTRHSCKGPFAFSILTKLAINRLLTHQKYQIILRLIFKLGLKTLKACKLEKMLALQCVFNPRKNAEY